jgi:2-oxoisovalerate dehydrogenase E1 component
VNRAAGLEAAFLDHVGALPPAAARSDLGSPVRPGTSLTARDALALFQAQIESRILDLLARELKAEGQSFYTIGSSGHEGNTVLGRLTRPDDPAFLHYRSGALFLARAHAAGGPEGALDVLLGLVASSDEPIAGGRHKVFGSVPLCIPPQTSTIASHLPKALGTAVAIDRRARLEGRTDNRIVLCTFGDASVNHAVAQTAFNAAGWTAVQSVPAPVLFVCEDNGIGISVRTPTDWVRSVGAQRAGLAYFEGDGLDLPSAWDAAAEAIAWVRERRRPAFLRLQTVRLLGHAGSDVEVAYRDAAEIADAEARDPLRASASLLVGGGWMTPGEVASTWMDARRRLGALAVEAVRRPKLTTATEVMAPLFRHDAGGVAAAVSRPSSEQRRRAHADRMPEDDARPRHLAVQINRALADELAARPNALLFGEDVARKGGVYHVTADLLARFGPGRVFNTLLDETSILGLAIGAAQEGLLPIPEIQYLAYLINAVDQLRGEAGSLQFFSSGALSNGMLVRIAGLAYQKGFGGHFHNDHGIGSLRDVPGLVVGCPARGADAVRMLRTLAAAAASQGRVAVLLEPIALYMTRDLHREGDGLWMDPYPAPGQALPLGEVGLYGPEDARILVVSYANGLWMSLRVAERLGPTVRVLDLRWLHPLPFAAVRAAAARTGRVLVAHLALNVPGVRLAQVVAPDSYIPLGDAANLVLVQEPEIEAAARALLAAP